MPTDTTLPLPPGAPSKNKAQSRSVSLPQWLWDIIEAHAQTTASGDRSGYIRELAINDLRRLGKLPGTTANALVAEFAEMLADPQGEDLARKILLEMAQEKAGREFSALRP